jgi:ribonuclease HI
MTTWSKPVSDDIAARLVELERSLLDPVTRASPEETGRMVHPDFLEVGSSGARYDREMVIRSMATGPSGSVVVRDFEAIQLAEGVVLCTYRSVGPSGRETRRSSVWIEEGGDWSIIFHQGTRVPSTWSA